MVRLVTRGLATAALVVGATVGLVGCSSGGQSGVPAGAVVVDVRTPAEYAAGHLSGAVNVDEESPDFAASIGRLDKAGDYLLYCHSGNRAGAAARQMASLGFAHVTNLGGIDAAARKTGLTLTK